MEARLMRTSFKITMMCLLLLSCKQQEKLTPKADSPFAKVTPVEETFKFLPIDEIKPEGWLKAQLQENLNGFTGNLDQLVPDLIVKDDIYGKDRLTTKVKNKDVGAVGVPGDWQVQFLWWNSETQSNWRDGYIRSAILTRDEAHLKKLDAYVTKILSTQDADGYLGIYDAEMRYRFENENGELWAKSSLLRGLLAWYEYTHDEKILTAIERAVEDVMKNYPVDNSHPFYSKKPDVGGTSHGLTITDVFESLYRITGKEKYRDYCLFLYKDFSEQVLNEDAQYKKLIDARVPLNGHGVHTYEHLRSLAAAYSASGNPKLKKAIDDFLVKIETETTASGAGVGDEWIAGRKADATSRGYEYCSLHELMHSYIELMAKSGNEVFGDKAEKIFLNAAQGARHPRESCIAYLKSDNSYAMTGGLNGDTSNEHQTRYKYSPVHQDAAVCCVPNAGRITPYYVTSMWMKSDSALVASLLGPSEVNTRVGDHSVIVREETNYPFDNVIHFKVTANGTFALKIRKPSWAKTFNVSEAFTEEHGFIVINKAWKDSEDVSVEFVPEVTVRQDLNGENYFTYGALVLAAPIESIEIKSKNFPLPGFHDLKYAAKKNVIVYEYANEPVTKANDKLVFQTSLVNPETKKKEVVTLVPLGETVLRQTTFKTHN
jgi:DUF1680 family protein